MATVFNPNGAPVDQGQPRNVNIPSSITDEGLMSTTSLASDCFIKQQFSNKLQAYLIGYVNSIYSDYPVLV